MVNMYLELFPGGNKDSVIISVLAWSHGISSSTGGYGYEAPKKKVRNNPIAELNVSPKTWTPEVVTLWLNSLNLEEISRVFENKISGTDLLNLSVTTAELKDLGIGPLDRIRFDSALTELRTSWSGEEDTDSQNENRISVQDMSCTCYMDDRTIATMHYLTSNTAYKSATVTTYHGNRRGRRNQQPAIEAEDDPTKPKENDPVIQVEMFNVTVSSVSCGGSGGENRFTLNLSLSFTSFAYKGQTFPSDMKKTYKDYYPLTFGCEAYYNEAKKESYYREYGKIVNWSHSNHYNFPEEFQNLVKTMLLVHNRKEEGNLLQYLPDSTLDLVIYFLSKHYILVSPLENSVFPGPKPDEDGANNNDDDYY